MYLQKQGVHLVTYWVYGCLRQVDGLGNKARDLTKLVSWWVDVKLGLKDYFVSLTTVCSLNQTAVHLNHAYNCSLAL